MNLPRPLKTLVDLRSDSYNYSVQYSCTCTLKMLLFTLVFHMNFNQAFANFVRAEAWVGVAMPLSLIHTCSYFVMVDEGIL